MEHLDWLHGSLIYLAAAVLAVPLARWLGLGSIIGYLAAGIAIGPWGLKLVTDAQTILHFAEFGVVLMLFLVGLELEPRRLWAMRRPIFGWGTVQLLGSAALMGLTAAWLSWPLGLGVVAALGLALSSTAIGLGVLAERHLQATTAGQGVLSVALLQDIAAIPILALVPLLGAGSAAPGEGWIGALKAVAVVVGIVLVGRRVLHPALRWIARSETPEIFTASALLLVVATAALMQSAGLSMALGAFLAGVLLAESEYRRALETDLEPFKGLLLGLFFIAVGMSIDFAVVLAEPALVVALVLGMLLLKSVVLVLMARGMDVPLAERPVFVILLAQGGEFGFVVFQSALAASVITPDWSSRLVAVVALSMLLTPLLLVLTDRFLMPRLARGPAVALDEIAEPQHAPIIICGFGRYGQIVGRLLSASGLSATVLDHSADQVQTVRQFGWPAFYGDATRLDLLRVAGAAQACAIVVAVDDIEQGLAIVDLAQAHFPQATLVVRARNAQHWYALHARGVVHIERETLDAALLSGRTVLERMGWPPHEARTQALRFRQHSIELMHRLAPHREDTSRFVAMSRQGREQLEELWGRERAEAKTTSQAQAWSPPSASNPEPGTDASGAPPRPASDATSPDH